jgi:hypothetical protein
MFLRGKLEKLPESNEFSPNLTKLTLISSELMEDPMATLEKLPNLPILILDDYSYVGKEMVCSAQGFPLLESLHVVELPELEEWIVEEGAMPRLIHLRIWNCSHLKMLPEGLQHVTTLKKLEVLYMPNEFNTRIQENGGEDWHKIQHILSIEIKQRAIKAGEFGCLFLPPTENAWKGKFSISTKASEFFFFFRLFPSS